MAERIKYCDFQAKVLGFAKVALVDFYSDTCIPCKRMVPVLTALENQYQDELYVAKVNVAYEKELVEEYQVKTTPTFLIFKNGRLAERLSGVRKKEELEQSIEANR